MNNQKHTRNNSMLIINSHPYTIPLGPEHEWWDTNNENNSSIIREAMEKFKNYDGLQIEYSTRFSKTRYSFIPAILIVTDNKRVENAPTMYNDEDIDPELVYDKYLEVLRTITERYNKQL